MPRAKEALAVLLAALLAFRLRLGRSGRILGLGLALSGAAACSPPVVPVADRTGQGALTRPTLMPIDALLAEADQNSMAEAAIDPVEGRLADLRSRAAKLRQR